jgi:Glycine cleavage H-protein
MRRALRVAAAGFFIVRVRLRHKFRECGVHLHVVGNKPYGQGWIFVLKIDNADDLKQLKDAATYKEQIG